MNRADREPTSKLILSSSSRNRIPRSAAQSYDGGAREPGEDAESPMSIDDVTQSNVPTVPGMPRRLLTLSSPFDLARTAAPAWWARGRWPNVDWRSGAFVWVGWEAGQVAWRSVRQIDPRTLEISGSRTEDLDGPWAAAVLGTNAAMPKFDDPILAALARKHAGLRPVVGGLTLRRCRLVDRRPEHQRRGRGDDRAAPLRAFQRCCCRRRPPVLAAAAAGATSVQQRGVCPTIGGDHETRRGARSRRHTLRIRAGFGKHSPRIRARLLKS